jgi:phosphate transport system permease protein
MAVSTTDIVEHNLRRHGVDWKGVLFEGALLLALLISMGALVILLARIFSQGISVLTDRGGSFLTGSMSSLPARAGIWQGLVGSLLLMGFVVLAAFPVGIAAAVYLEEYAPDTAFTRFITANVRNLAGVPSIVYGLLGLAIFVKAMAGFTGGLSVISGGLTLAILVLPIVVITASEGLRAVPQGIREAGYGVGGTKWEVVRSHVLPAAAPGILTGTVLSLARAFGETAPLILTGAVTGVFFTGSGSFLDKLHGAYTSLPTIVYGWSRLPQEAFQQLTAAAIIVLLVMLLTVNASAIWLRNRYERKW